MVVVDRMRVEGGGGGRRKDRVLRYHRMRELRFRIISRWNKGANL